MPKQSVSLQENINRSRAEAEAFRHEVIRYEEEADEDPDAFLKKAYRWANYPLVFVIVMILLLILIFALLLWIMIVGRVRSPALAIAAGATIFYLIRGLFLKSPDSPGYYPKRSDLPELWRIVDEVTDTVEAPRVDDILLSTEPNANAYVRPQWGLFGPKKRTLTIGYPLFFLLSPDELKFVIAHESGHFGGKHGEQVGKVYQVEQLFREVIPRVSGMAGGAMVSFARWFWPKFQPMAAVVSRLHEFEADKAAARAAPAEGIRMLHKLDVAQVLLDRPYLRLFDESISAEGPSVSPFTTLPLAYEKELQSDETRSILKASLAQKPSPGDTHPLASERMRGLGVPECSLDELLEYVRHFPWPDAAAEFLGARRAVVERGIWNALLSTNHVPIEERRIKIRESSEVIARLRPKAEAGSLTEDDTFDLAEAYRLSGQFDQAKSVMQQFLEKDRLHPGALAWLGVHMANEGDPQAEPYLHRALEVFPENREMFLDALTALKMRSGSTDAEQIMEAALQASARQELLDSEFRELHPNSGWGPTGLEPSRAERVRAIISEFKKVASAYLVDADSKVVEGRTYTFVVCRLKGFVADDSAYHQQAQKIADRINDPDVFVLCPPKAKPWEEALERIPGAKIV